LFEKYFGNKNKILVPLYALSKFGTAVIGMVFISGLLKNIFFGSFAEQYYHYILFFLFYVFSCILVYYDISMHYILQKFIIIFKLIPLLVVILFFIFYFFNNSLSLNFFTFSNNNMFDFFKMAQGMSITIFAFAGFESLFAINHLLIGNKRKGALLLSISFLFSLILYVLYQFSISSLAALVNLDILKINSFSDFLTSCLIFMPFAQIFILLFNAAIMICSY
jgi:amino acid transporter